MKMNLQTKNLPFEQPLVTVAVGIVVAAWKLVIVNGGVTVGYNSVLKDRKKYSGGGIHTVIGSTIISLPTQSWVSTSISSHNHKVN